MTHLITENTQNPPNFNTSLFTLKRMKAHPYTSMAQATSPTPPPRSHHSYYSISPANKLLLAIFLVLSVTLFPFVLKKPKYIPCFLLSTIMTIKYYEEVDHEASKMAHNMKRKMTTNEIKIALLTPPSPKFDRHVRCKILTMLNN